MKIEFFNNTSIKFEDVMKIRNTVFELEQGAIAEEELDEYDKNPSTVYALVYNDDVPVATGRIAQTHSGFKIGRIAVLKSQRGQGTGALLVNSLCERAYELGANGICVDAQLHAVPFYEKLGFNSITNKTIIDRGIEHLPMRK